MVKIQQQQHNSVKVFLKSYSYFQSMTCDLFCLAALATPQPKSCPQPQPPATCFFDGNFIIQKYLIENFILDFFACEKLLKSPIFELQNLTYTKRKQISIVSSFIIAKKMCDIVVALRKPENARTYIASYYQNEFHKHIATCDHTSHLRNLWPHIASHALV